MSSIEERFQAAVNVIKGLPKNGPYQPSTSMMLEFYGLYKQATKGSCSDKKPAFWDVYGKAKWDAWQKKSHLTQHQAMEQYVDCLQRIIETMSYTENVQTFIGSLSDLENINLDELDKVSPGMKELAESHPNSPFNTRQNSPQHLPNLNGESGQNGLDLISTASGISEELTYTPSMTTAKATFTDDKGSRTNSTQALVANQLPDHSDQNTQSDDEYVDPFDMQNDLAESLLLHTELLKQIQVTVAKMNSDIRIITQRLGAFESFFTMLSRQVNSLSHRDNTLSLRYTNRYFRWWPFDNISPKWFLILLLWPFFGRRLFLAVKRKTLS